MGLLRGLARTAAIAGTATAVSNRVSRRQAGRWAAKDQQADEQQQGQYADQQPQYAQPPPAASSTDDRLDQLQKLGELKASGCLPRPSSRRRRPRSWRADCVPPAAATRGSGERPAPEPCVVPDRAETPEKFSRLVPVDLWLAMRQTPTARGLAHTSSAAPPRIRRHRPRPSTSDVHRRPGNLGDLGAGRRKRIPRSTRQALVARDERRDRLGSTASAPARPLTVRPDTEGRRARR